MAIPASAFRLTAAMVAAASLVDLTFAKGKPTRWGPSRKTSAYIGLAMAPLLWIYAGHRERQETALARNPAGRIRNRGGDAAYQFSVTS